MTIHIKSCTCKSTYQDERYGKGRRVHNSVDDKKSYDWRCTVCKKET